MTAQFVTVVFSDVVDSTARAERLGPERADADRRAHFEVLRRVVSQRGGTEVKNLGDGLMLAFDSVADALDTAVALQQAVDAAGRGVADPVRIRIGLAAGDADVEDGDFFGPPVVEAARLCSAAAADQILTTVIVQALGGTRTGLRFDPVGDLELKGIEAPVAACSVAWEPLGAGTLSDVPLPARLRPGGGLPLVGRAAEQDALAEAWKAAWAGAARTVLLSGEAGIGKTRLSTELAAVAHDDGAAVLYGRCDEDLGVAYQPWVEALSHLVTHVDEAVLGDHLRRKGPELSRLVPGLRQRLPDLPELPAGRDPETERYALFGAVNDLLATVAAATPVLIVLDDLHWADRASLLLLKHVVGEGGAAAALLVGTYRDTDIDAEHPLTGVLADLRRIDGVERLALDGLADHDLVDLMESVADQQMDDDGVSLAHLIRQETRGNPFFAIEILRHLAESDAIQQRDDGRWVLNGDLADLGLPQSVREVVGHRIARLGEDTRRLLSLAAIIGRDFDLELLAGVADLDEDRALDLLDQAAAAGVIAEMVGSPGRYSFEHALIEHTLYDDLSATRRQRAHRRIGEVLELLAGDDPGDRIGELAHHWAEATRPADAAKAIDYARRAGRRALAQLAPADAARWFRRALDLLAATGRGEDRLHVELLVDLGDAERQAGDPAHRERLLDAGRSADRLDQVDLLVRSALLNTRGTTGGTGLLDAERLAVLDRALYRTPEPGVDRAALLATYCGHVLITSRGDEVAALKSEALRIADGLPDPDRCRVLVRLNHALLEQDLAAEAVTLADRYGDPNERFNAHLWMARFGFVTADPDLLHRNLAAARGIVEQTGRPDLHWNLCVCDATCALVAGDLADAERLLDDVLTLGTATGQPDVMTVYGGILFQVRREQGRLDEFLELFVEAVSADPDLVALRLALAMGYAELGRPDDVRSVLAGIIAADFVDIPDDLIWSTSMALAAECIVVLEDRDLARTLLDRLAEAPDETAYNGGTIAGANPLSRARLRAVLGDLDAAEADYAIALELFGRLGAAYWSATVDHELGLLLRRRARSGDAARARALITQAHAVAHQRGFVALERRTAELLDR